MSEFDDLGLAVGQAEQLLDKRPVQFTRKEGDSIMVYIGKRLVSPIVGLAPSTAHFVVTNLDEHPFGDFIFRLTKSLGGSKSDLLTMWIGENDFEMLT